MRTLGDNVARWMVLVGLCVAVLGFRAPSGQEGNTTRWEYGELRAYRGQSGMGFSWRLAGGSFWQIAAGEDSSEFMMGLNDGEPWARSSDRERVAGMELQVLGMRGWEVIQRDSDPQGGSYQIYLKRKLP